MRFRPRATYALAALLVLAAFVAWRRAAPPGPLARLDAVVDDAIDHGIAAGVVAVVERDGTRIYQRVAGERDRESHAPMRLDAIFRIYSMTKPIVSVAALILCDDGKLALDDPVAKYLPQLAEMHVGVEVRDDATGASSLRRVPAERAITVRDLVRHTAGFTYGEGEVGKLVQEADLLRQDRDLAGMVDVLSKLPLERQPGTAFEYSPSIDVLGRVIEVVAAQPLDVFLEERVCAPLGMVDTGFRVPESKLARLAAPYLLDKGVLVRQEKPPMLGPPTERPKLLSGGAGLYSTAGDYLRFARMLCDGSLDGARILKPETARAVREDQLEGRPVSGPMAAMLRDGFGLGVALIREPGRGGQPGSVGYGWVGAAGTSFWVDPDHGIAGVFLTQTWTRLDMGAAFQREAYAALHD